MLCFSSYFSKLNHFPGIEKLLHSACLQYWAKARKDNYGAQLKAHRPEASSLPGEPGGVKPWKNNN
jgi:hypothetical protein